MITNPIDSKFASPLNLDKVARVFTGTYGSADLITRTGGFALPYVFRFRHEMPRPGMCEVITSTDGGTTWDLGVGKIAFCDSTYIYIFHGYATTGTPVTYKVYYTWIDNYDSTNPSIESQVPTSNNIQFDSRSNFQKIFLQDEIGFTAGTFGSSQTRTITHSLGYQPNAKVFFEAFSGEVWPLNIGGVRNAYLYHGDQDECGADIYSDRLDITLYRFSNVVKRAWYRIYYDAN